jgi:translation initiation factor 3 subunit C
VSAIVKVSVSSLTGRKIQEESLRTYIFTHAPFYASLSLSHLATTFSLSRSVVLSLVSRMIYTDEIAGSLDPIDDVVIFHRVEPTEVQRLAQTLAERAVGLMDQNEKAMDTKLGQSQNAGQADGARNDGQQQKRGGGERRGGARGSYRGRGGRGRAGGFQSGLGGARTRVTA